MYILHSKVKLLPATMESSSLLLWVKGDSTEADAINWPPIALLSKPSISANHKSKVIPKPSFLVDK